jgi:hypothetical protein
MLDRPTVYAISNRLWGSASGLVTAVLVASYFTPELQGFYFTFLSLLTLQTFVELGFGELLQQFVSREWAMISSSNRSERALDRLSGLIRFALRDLRAHKAEPYAALSLVEGFLAIPLFTLLGAEFESLGIVLGFLGLTTATLVPAISIFGRCRKLWHQRPRWVEA